MFRVPSGLTDLPLPETVTSAQALPFSAPSRCWGSPLRGALWPGTLFPPVFMFAASGDSAPPIENAKLLGIP